MRKRLCKMVVAVMVVCALLCLVQQFPKVNAVGDERCGNSVTWDLSADGVLTISGTGTMWDYTWNWDENWNMDVPPWRDNILDIKAVVIEQGVTTIGEMAFWDAENLQTISIADSVVWIGKDALSGCKSLKTIWIPKNVNRIGEDAFRGTSVDGFWVDPENKHFSNDEQGVLFNKNKTILIKAPTTLSGEYIVPNTVTEIASYAIAGCPNLTGLFFSSETLQETGSGIYAIGACENLKTLSFTGGPVSFNDFFYGEYPSLETLTIGRAATDLPGGNYPALLMFNVHEDNAVYTSVDGVLYSKDMKTLINYPNGKTGHFTVPESITTIKDGAVSNCTQLIGVTLPDGIQEIGFSAFSGCTALVAINLPNTLVSVEGKSFSGCTALEEVCIPDSVSVIGLSTFKDCSSLRKVALPTSITAIARNAFSGCTSLAEIILPENLTILDENAFTNCKSLQQIIIPDKVSQIDYSAFSGCTALEKVTVGKGVELILGTAFENCTNLKEIRFTGRYPFNTNYSQDVFLNVTATCYYPDNILSWSENTLGNFGGTITWVAEEIDEFANETHTYAVPGTNAVLAYRIGLDGKTAEISLCNKDVTGVLAIPAYIDGYEIVSIGDSAFYECIGLTSVTMPNTIRSIGDLAFYRCYRANFVFSENLQTIGEEAFRSTSMSKVVLPDSIQKIGKGTFSYCSSLNEIVLPASLKHIPENMFAYCYYLRYVTLPEDVISIGNRAFYSCYELHNVTFPDGLKEIGEYAFYWCGPSRTYELYYNCWYFTVVELPDSVQKIGKYAFAGCQSLNKINIPEGVTTIEAGLFNGCYSLRSITLPCSVQKIAEGVFGDSYISSITFQWGAPEIDAATFASRVNATCYYPSNNPNWTASMLQNYGANQLTWIAMEMENPGEGVGGEGGTAGGGTEGGGVGGDTGESGDTGGNDDSAGGGENSGGNGSGDGNGGNTGDGETGGGNTSPGGSGSGGQGEGGSEPETYEVSFGEKVYHNLRLQDLTKIGYAFTITTDVSVDAYGVLIWTGDADAEVTVGIEGVQNKILTYDNGFYTAESDGIYAQRLDAVHYAKPYVKIGDQYIYGSVDIYSPLTYAQTILDGTDEELKQLMIDLLNYGTYAQLYFAESNKEPVPDVLINDVLTEEQKVMNWSDDLKVATPAVTKDTAKTLETKWYGTNLNLLEAIQMNMAATGDIAGMYYWTEDAYNSAEILDGASASGQAVIRTDGIYTIGGLTGIVAQSVSDVYYVCGYDANSNLGTIRADSVAAYATRLMESTASTEATKNLAKALLIYGNSAEMYFAENK